MLHPSSEWCSWTRECFPSRSPWAVTLFVLISIIMLGPCPVGSRFCWIAVTFASCKLGSSCIRTETARTPCSKAGTACPTVPTEWSLDPRARSVYRRSFLPACHKWHPPWSDYTSVFLLSTVECPWTCTSWFTGSCGWFNLNSFPWFIVFFCQGKGTIVVWWGAVFTSASN